MPKARAALGLSVKKLAVAARVAPQTIVRFERGKKSVPVPSPAFVKFSKRLARSSPTSQAGSPIDYEVIGYRWNCRNGSELPSRPARV